MLFSAFIFFLLTAPDMPMIEISQTSVDSIAATWMPPPLHAISSSRVALRSTLILRAYKADKKVSEKTCPMNDGSCTLTKIPANQEIVISAQARTNTNLGGYSPETVIGTIVSFPGGKIYSSSFYNNVFFSNSFRCKSSLMNVSA